MVDARAHARVYTIRAHVCICVLFSSLFCGAIVLPTDSNLKERDALRIKFHPRHRETERLRSRTRQRCQPAPEAAARSAVALLVRRAVLALAERPVPNTQGGRDVLLVVVYRNGKWLRPDLFEHLPKVETEADAKCVEARHAETLAGLGFHAYYDSRLVRPDRVPDTVECSALRTSTHVEQVSDPIDQLIFAAIAALTPSGESGKTTPLAVASLLGPKDEAAKIHLEISFPERSRLSYLESGVIETRIEQLKSMGILRSRDNQVWIPDAERVSQ